jgi:hypothetical protein
MLSLQEVKKFIDSSKLYGSSSEYVHEYTAYNSYSFVHVTGIRLVVLLGDKTCLSQMLFGSVVSPAVLWRWDDESQLWEVDDYDFFLGSFSFRTISDFASFYGLNVKGA